MGIFIGNKFPKVIGLGISFTKSFISSFLTWGKSSPARFWGTTTPEIWGVTESADIVVNQFKNRVIADGGIFEAQSCMTAQIQSLFDIQSNIPIGIDVQAQAHFNRVIADGGVVPAGFDGVNSFFRLVKSVYNTTDINTAISAAYDPHYLGYKLGAGSGTTLGQAAQTLYSVKSTENLLLQSEDFANASWTKSGVTITSNSITAPNGTLTADTFNGTAASFISAAALSLTPQNYTISIYVKKLISSSISISFEYHQSGSNNTLVTFNFDTGVISGGTVETLANGWFRIRATTNITANRNQLRIVSADSFYIWGAQLNTGSVALPYTQTTTTAQTLADVTQTTAASQPLLLAHTGENYWFQPGLISGNFVLTPNAAANQITGDIDIIAYISKKTNSCEIIAKENGGSDMAYILMTENSSILQFRYSISSAPTTQIIIADNQALPTNFDGWVRFTRIVSTGAYQFYSSTNPSNTSINSISWTNRGSGITNSGINLRTNNNAVRIGLSLGVGFANTLSIYRATIANSIGGTPVVDFNPSSYNPATSQTQWTSATGEVWTINTGTDATGYKGVLVDRTIVQGDGIDDLLSRNEIILSQFTIYNANRGLGLVANGALMGRDGFNNLSVIYSGTNPPNQVTIFKEGFFNYGSMTISRLNMISIAYDSTSLQGSVNNIQLVNNTSGTLITQGITRLLRGRTDSANAIIATHIESSTKNNSTQQTGIYDVIRRFNNNAF